ncbi:DMT family transporter [uncultured Streptococcus sp.]|uniref:DMT family transporter n=1 Tax=uncultured Streptococcus sp. TaxID=83427 RepID=UPI0027DD77AE|nr:DMT family transporter [uncultured Streptococcus sp.]
MSKELKGSLMVLIAGSAWGISGVSGQYLMSHGVSVNLLTSLRLLISGIILIAIVAFQQPKELKKAVRSKSFVLPTIMFSIFGLVMNQYAYLQAINHTNAGTATVLQYMTPVLILALVCLKNRTLPTTVEVGAIILAIAGTFIMSTHGKIGSLAITPLGLFWGLGSAVTYAAYILIPVKVIREWGSLVTIGSAMLIGGVTFSLVTRAWTLSTSLDAKILLAYFGIIGVGTVFAYTIFLMGVTMIGAVKGSLLASIEPVASVILTVLIMGAHFYLSDFLGMLCILMAVLLISLKDLVATSKMSKN